MWTEIMKLSKEDIQKKIDWVNNGEEQQKLD